jgi:hypothetical protein
MAAHCRSCGAPLATLFVDLGPSPISNAFRTTDELSEPETFYPLRAYVCEACWLVQLDDVAGRDTHFNADYAYFSSYSSTWLEHAERFAAMAIDRLRLGSSSRVVEVASNDDYLLIGLKQERKIIAGYGAPAKGNTLLNYCGIRTDFIDFTVDRNPAKQGRFLRDRYPGSGAGRAAARNRTTC